MRKVLAVLVGLILASFFAACSEDSTTPTPPAPQPSEFEITTAELPAGLTCTPYNVSLEATGGTAPYTWSLAEGSDPLPSGLTITPDGRIKGVIDSEGEWTFTVKCTDSESNSVEQTYTVSVGAPENPSIAVFFDTEATVCNTETQAFAPLDCYVYITFDAEQCNCAKACEYKLRIVDAEGNDLEDGTQYGIMELTYPDWVNLTLGVPFSGVAISFSRPMYGPDPVLITSFKLILLENLDELAFKLEPNPTGGHLGIATCDDGYPIVDVTGRTAVINY